MKIIDVNAAFGFWPIQRFSANTLEELESTFAKAGVEEVWLSAIESILFPEPDSWDTRLFARLADFPRFRPVKTVNPILANWQQGWDRVRASLAAVKLFPNYHGYSLDDDRVAEICRKAVEEKIPVLIPMRVNDERNQPHFLQVKGVSAEEIVALSLRHPETCLVALCPYNWELFVLAKGGRRLLMDFSFLDGITSLDKEMKNLSTLERASGVVSPDRLVFGSGEAFLHLESAKRKLQFGNLPEDAAQGIASGNISSAY